MVGRAKTMVKSPKLLRWPSALTLADGYLWMTSPALHEIASKRHQPPYHILRVSLIKPKQANQGSNGGSSSPKDKLNSKNEPTDHTEKNKKSEL